MPLCKSEKINMNDDKRKEEQLSAKFEHQANYICMKYDKWGLNFVEDHHKVFWMIQNWFRVNIGSTSLFLRRLDQT